MTFSPFMLGVVVVMAFGPMLRWRSDSLKPTAGALMVPFTIGLGVGLMFGVIGRSLPGGLGFGFGAFLVASLARWLLIRTRLGSVPFNQSLLMARSFPRATWGFLGAHLGFAVAVFGITAMSAWTTETLAPLKPGGSAQLGDRVFTLTNVENVQGPNYEAKRLNFTVTSRGVPDGEISTERRYYPERDTSTTEAGIRAGVLANIYLASSEETEQGAYVVRLNFHPLAMWIWAGGLMMAGGGMISLSDRRFRIGAPHKVRAAAAAAV
jgi:cytochrome c-type biogenesis protein CcmF